MHPYLVALCSLVLVACGGAPSTQAPPLHADLADSSDDARSSQSSDGGVVTTPDGMATDLASAPTGTRIKWNPGHYMASNNSLTNDGADIDSSGVSADLAALEQFPQMKGYLIYVYWAHLEATEGDYNFAVLDATLTKLKQAGQHLVIHLIPGPATGGSTVPSKGDFSCIPKYILTDPKTYGPSLPGGDPNGYGGYWGASSGGYFANLSNANVMARFVALVDALGKHYDADAAFEGVVAVNETANMYPVAAAGISPATYLAVIEQMAAAAVAAFPTTSVMVQNTWMGPSIQDSYDLEAWMYAHRVAPSTPDTFGATAFEKYNYDMPNGSLAWGMQAYFGLADSGITGVADRRPTSRAMIEVQPGEMGIYQHLGANAGGPFTPADIANAAETYYQASHVFWTHFFGTEQSNFPAADKWENLAPAVLAVPLTHTGYPQNYPQ